MFLKRLIHIIQHSFCSKDFYIDLYRNVKGLKVQYFIILLCITNLAFIIPTYVLSKNAVENNVLLAETNLNYIKSQLPETIAIKDHILELPDNIQEILYSEDKQPVIGFAIKNNLESLKAKDIPLIITKNGSYIRADNQYLFISFSLHMPKDSFISPQMIISQIKLIQSNLGFIFVIFYLVSTVIKGLMICLHLLFFLGFGFLYMKMQKTTPDFLSLCRVSMFAVFPSIIIEFIFNIYIAITHHSLLTFQQSLNAPFKSNLIFFIAVGYFYYALFYITKSYKNK